MNARQHHPSLWQAVTDRVREWRRRSRTRAELRRIDDETLRDMGIYRSTSNVEAAKPFWMP